MKEFDIENAPRLDSVLIVEKYIKKYDGELNKDLLIDKLPKEINEQILDKILNFLSYSKKISIDSEGKYGWIHYPENSKIYLKDKNLFWRKDETSI